MEIYVRNSDGLVLNSYEFNSSFPAGIDNKNMYAGEDYTIYDITDIPNDPEREYFLKIYHFIGEVLKLEYVPEKYSINKEIVMLKSKLSTTDYKIIKSYEAMVMNKEVEYNMTEIHESRQAIRDKINELLEYLKL